MKTVAVIGAGALGKVVVRNLKKLSAHYILTGILTRTPAVELAREAGCRTFADIAELLSERPDYVVEIAGAPAVKDYGEAVLRGGSDLIIVSSGALADQDFFALLQRAARDSGRKIHVASGAIGGFDLMRTLALMGEMVSSIENLKPPEGLEGAPYLEGRLLSRTETETVFTGNVEEAILGFPKNVNVAAALDAAVMGTPCVVIRSIPGLSQNRHIIRLNSHQAQAEISVASAPDPDNPRSSTITAWSVLALLENLASPVQFF